MLMLLEISPRGAGREVASIECPATDEVDAASFGDSPTELILLTSPWLVYRCPHSTRELLAGVPGFRRIPLTVNGVIGLPGVGVGVLGLPAEVEECLARFDAGLSS